MSQITSNSLAGSFLDLHTKFKIEGKMTLEQLVNMDMGEAAEWLVDNHHDFVLVPRHDVTSAIESLRYAAHPYPSPHADDLEKAIEAE